MNCVSVLRNAVGRGLLLLASCKARDDGAMVIPIHLDKRRFIFRRHTDTTVAPVSQPRILPDQPRFCEEMAFLMRGIKEGARNDAEQGPFFTTAIRKSIRFLPGRRH